MQVQPTNLDAKFRWKVPHGQPDLPQATGVRALNRSFELVGTSNVSLDHHFHVAGVVPSVCILVDNLKNNSHSSHNGIIHVVVKDKIFQPSSALRHTVETVKIIRACR